MASSRSVESYLLNQLILSVLFHMFIPRSVERDFIEPHVDDTIGLVPKVRWRPTDDDSYSKFDANNAASSVQRFLSKLHT
jgi:hypothetical protein